MLLENEIITASQLSDFTVPYGCVGIQMDIQICILYLESCLRGVGDITKHNLLENAATAKISRAQLWQWIHHGAKTYHGVTINISMSKFLVADYVANGMADFSKLQQREFALQSKGFKAIKHQAFVGTGYFDAVQNTVTAGLSSTGALKGSTEEEQFH